MVAKFSPSVNIIRDAGKNLNYVVTSNAERAALTISDQFKKGIHAYTIIGSYGTGKSSFLWAMEQTLSKKKGLLPFRIACEHVRFLHFIGVYQSIIEHFREEFQIAVDYSGNQKIFDAIYQEYEKVKKKNGLLVILIDEFGKFLEYASAFNPERELYFIQQLAEFVNDHDRNILLVTTLHQSLEAYSPATLTDTQKQEWRKIKGRLKEITFNEPPQQLLVLAAKRLAQKSKGKTPQVNSVAKLEKAHRILSFEQSLIKEVEGALHPLDVLGAYILTLALQRYGQNERSLFTFMETESLGDKTMGIPEIYDYLFSEFYSYLTSKHNVDYTQWAIIRNAIERCEATLQSDTAIAISVIKTIGLLGIFAHKGANVNDKFLSGYFDLIYAHKNLTQTLNELKRIKIVRFNNYSQSYKLFEGTDVNIEQELLYATTDVAESINVAAKLRENFELPLLIAKSASYRKGTPRFFSFEITDELNLPKPVSEFDGRIILVINERLDENSVREFSKGSEEADLFGYFKKSKQITDVIFDIEKSLVVQQRNYDDIVVRKELDIILNSQRQILNHLVWDAFYNGDVEWIFRGETRVIRSRGDLNKVLSDICDTVYHKTPVYKNELINRQSISGPIHNARKLYFSALVNKSSGEDLGFAKDNFPPEKTIYITLLKETRIHVRSRNGYWDFCEPKKDTAFYHLWQACEQFLETCQHEKRALTEFFNLLRNRPFGLKQGFLEFWIPTYLFIKRDDFALYGDQGYIPEINESILYLMTRNAKEYYIKTFDVRGVRLDLFNKYRQLLQLRHEPKATNRSFIESIRPFLVLYKQLPSYSKNTSRLSPETLAIRKAIETAQDPERIFFEDFPKALRTNIRELSSSRKALDAYIINLQEALRELRTSLDNLIDRIELYLVREVLGDKKLKFPKYKLLLQSRYADLKEHRLLPKQRALLMRINSPLEDRKSWIASIVHVLLAKPVEHIQDEEEDLLKDRILFAIQEMDNLCEIHRHQNNDNEEVVKLNLTTTQGLTNCIIRLPKGKQSDVKNQFNKVKELLGSDKRVNVIILTQLLKEQLK